MNTTCSELRERAWNKLGDGRYMTSLAVSALGGVIADAGGVFTGGAASYGAAKYYLAQQRGEKAEFSDLFDGFANYGTSLVLCVLQTVYLFLWTLLLIVPGIIKSFAYGITYYVHLDFGITGTDAITKSRELMKGYKAKLFRLRLSFLGWILLGCVTGGVGLVFLSPYVEQAMAEFYVELLADRGIQYVDGKIVEPEKVDAEEPKTIEDSTPAAEEVFEASAKEKPIVEGEIVTPHDE